MNKNQRMLIKLLDYAIHKESLSGINYKDINWRYIIKESKAHSIYPMLYPIIKDISSPEFISQELKQKWKISALSTAIFLDKQRIQLERVFKLFNNANIPVIGLKGLFLRDYYPYPDLRTMNDTDILVNKEDIEKVHILLTVMGYIQTKESTPAHITFIHKQYSPIEVHWTLADNRYLSGVSKFESEIWSRAVIKKIGEAEILCLYAEDFLIHLCIHMAVHLRSGGFGLRQLCDAVLLIEGEANNLNWQVFKQKSSDIGIERFCSIVLDACNMFFNTSIPQKLLNPPIDKKCTTLLMEDILNSGVFGRKSSQRVFGNNLLNAEIIYKSGNSNNKKSVLSLICPPVNTLSYRYNYAKRYRVLIPIAWIHHFVSGLFNKEYSLLEKIKFLLFSTSTFRKRENLLHHLELFSKD